MELTLKEGFTEVTKEERMNIEGGSKLWGAFLGATFGFPTVIFYDLYNEWLDGYNDVVSSTPPANGTVSCGDAIY